MSFYWRFPDSGMAETPAERDLRMEQNLQSFFYSMSEMLRSSDEKFSSLLSTLSRVADSTDRSADALYALSEFVGNTNSARASALQEAYTYAVLQERQEFLCKVRELLTEAEYFGPFFKEFDEHLKSKPELKKFLEEVRESEYVRKSLGS